MREITILFGVSPQLFPVVLASVPFQNGIVCFVSWSDGCCFSDSAALILDLDVNFGVFFFYPCLFDIICGMERLRHTFIRLRRSAKKALLGVDKMKKPAGQ